MRQLRKLHWLTAASLVLALGLAGCGPRENVKVTNIQPARVDQASPSKSFWKDTVHYPFPVKYAHATDARGVTWEIAYMDEYAGTKGKDKAKTLVLVHGKGASAGYWGELMRDALASGMRVIAFDIPGYGKSIPGNLNNPVARTLQDTRQAVNALLTKQLGVSKATFLGHSMGGQWVIGYAVSYPQNVEKLILEAPAGLEEYPRAFKVPSGELPLMDASYAHDLKRWEEVWGPTGRLAAERAKTAEWFKLFYWYKKKNPTTGAIEASPIGYFLNDSPDARFETDTRVGMFEGPRAEHDLYILNTQRDVYTMGLETNKEDPKSLTKRLSEISAPVFIAFGEKEPFIPTTVASGNSDLKWEVIRPAYKRLSAKGPAPVVKLYKDAGHFIHTDQPVAFAKDVIDFVYDGAIYSGTENVSSYKAPAVKLPADIAAFFEADHKAVMTGKAVEIIKHYHKDFQSDGRNWAAQNDLLQAYGSQFPEKYEVKVTGLDIQGDKALLNGSITTKWGAASMNGTYLIKEGGKWYWYGNRK